MDSLSERVQNGIEIVGKPGIPRTGYGDCIGSKLLCGRMREGTKRVNVKRKKREDVKSRLDRM